MQIIFASKNKGKIHEMKEILSDFDIISSDEAGVKEDVEEDGKTFEENALKKARYVAQKTGLWSMADDSGLCIEALNNEPGIYTARWAGEGASGDDLVQHTLKKMKEIPEEKRQAFFESDVALVSLEGKEYIFKGRVNGKIAEKPSGEALPKLPYDVLFIPKGYSKTFAEMTSEEKNQISHRGLAFQKLKEFLENL